MSSPKRRDSLDDIALYYRNNDEDSRRNVQQLEFWITRHLLTKYLKGKNNILELGAGSGTYTRLLAEAGHRVTAIELVQKLADQNSQSLVKSGLDTNVRVITGDARDLKILVNEKFDAVVAMGPFYHLEPLGERMGLLQDMSSVTKGSGVVITTHMSRIGLMGYMLMRFPQWILDSKQVSQILAGGHLREHPRDGQFRGYFSTLDEIRDLHESNGLSVVQIHSQDPCIGSADEIFNDLPDLLKSQWAEALARISHDPLALGSGRSLLCVSTKQT